MLSLSIFLSIGHGSSLCGLMAPMLHFTFSKGCCAFSVSDCMAAMVYGNDINVSRHSNVSKWAHKFPPSQVSQFVCFSSQRVPPHISKSGRGGIDLGGDIKILDKQSLNILYRTNN